MAAQFQVTSLEEDAANQSHINKELKDQLNSATAQLSDKQTELETFQSELATIREELEAQLRQNQELSTLKVIIFILALSPHSYIAFWALLGFTLRLNELYHYISDNTWG